MGGLKQARERRDRGKFLRMAAGSGDIAWAKVIMAAGCSLDSSDKNGKAALLCTAVSGHLPMVDYLIKAGADLGSRDKIGGGVLHYAARGANVDCLERLLEAGCLVGGAGKKGDGVRRHALIWTLELSMGVVAGGAKSGMECVKLLLAAGCELDRVEIRGEASAWKVARRYGLEEAAEMILAESERRILSKAVGMGLSGAQSMRM